MKNIYEIEYSKVCLELELILKKAEQKILNDADVEVARDVLRDSNENIRLAEIDEGMKNE